MVEFGVFNGIPHLLEPTITDFRRVSQALNKLTVEMDKRYEKFATYGVRNISKYNRKMKQEGKSNAVIPYIVVVTDEFADLMMVIGEELEDAITRIAQKARACGIHIILATQRPSVDVVTGVLESNIPSRIAVRYNVQVSNNDGASYSSFSSYSTYKEWKKGSDGVYKWYGTIDCLPNYIHRFHLFLYLN